MQMAESPPQHLTAAAGDVDSHTLHPHGAGGINGGEQESTSGEEDQPHDNTPPSKATMDRSLAAKLYIEQHYMNLMQSSNGRAERRMLLEQKMQNLKLSQKEQNDLRAELNKRETEFMRLRRRKLSPKDFETIKIIGRGAFGEVRLVRQVDTNEIFAMKKLRKQDMLQREQVAHVRAERDILVLANTGNSWVVKLFYSFQDPDYLYLVMEYLAGGDMMSLLIKYEVFSEDVARFYLAETLLAIESVHKLNFIHRDIKPDNLLLDERGHVKLTDFGLCTGFHRMHSSAFYAKLVGDAMTIKLKMVAETPLTRTERLASWKQNRRNLAYSAVGTPDYTAPEVFLQLGYGFEVDWWSLGVIAYEMLVGYPPFLSETSTETCVKILNSKESLRFPADLRLSHAAQDLIERLVCDRAERLGRDEIKAHPFFRGINWDTIREARAPYVPDLKSPIDTSHFDEIEDVPEPAPPPSSGTGATSGASSSGAHSSSRRPSGSHGPPANPNSGGAAGGAEGDAATAAAAEHHGIRMVSEKDLPFIGYTYKGFDGLYNAAGNGHGHGRTRASSGARKITLDELFANGPV